MLRSGEPVPQLRKWLDHLAPVVEEAKDLLREIEPTKLTLRTGCERAEDGGFRLHFFWQEYTIASDDFTVRACETGAEPPSFTQSLILTYLATADGATPSGRWIGFRELPNGLFYTQAFQGYTGGRLVRELQSGIDGLRQAADRLGGENLGMGDAGYIFNVLPRIALGLAYWEGDDEFPSQASVLFEDSAPHYLPTDGLAILGSQLVGRLLKTVPK